MNPKETHALAELIRRLRDEFAMTILLIEHDMALVMEVCQHIYVMDFGHLIFEGSPDEVRTSPVVQAAYLGTETDLAPVVAGEQPTVRDPATT
jgi:ABC-type branched-subunit amino acid transport system ATPase component